MGSSRDSAGQARLIQQAGSIHQGFPRSLFSAVGGLAAEAGGAARSGVPKLPGYDAADQLNLLREPLDLHLALPGGLSPFQTDPGLALPHHAYIFLLSITSERRFLQILRTLG